MEALSSDDGEAGVGVAKDEDCIGLGGGKELVGAVNDVATSGAKIIAYSIHIDFGIGKLQVAEENAVEVVVVVLAGVGENHVEVLAALVDDCGKADDFRACAHHNDELQLAVLLPVNIGIIKFRLFLFHCYVHFIFFK